MEKDHKKQEQELDYHEDVVLLQELEDHKEVE